MPTRGSDSAHHCVLWISEWPRSLVYPGFLAPLLLSSGIRRTFTLLYTPMRPDRAARDIRKKKTEYFSDAAQVPIGVRRLPVIATHPRLGVNGRPLVQQAVLNVAHEIADMTADPNRRRPGAFLTPLAERLDRHIEVLGKLLDPDQRGQPLDARVGLHTR